MEKTSICSTIQANVQSAALLTLCHHYHPAHFHSQSPNTNWHHDCCCSTQRNWEIQRKKTGNEKCNDRYFTPTLGFYKEEKKNIMPLKRAKICQQNIVKVKAENRIQFLKHLSEGQKCWYLTGGNGVEKRGKQKIVGSEASDLCKHSP